MRADKCKGFLQNLFGVKGPIAILLFGTKPKCTIDYRGTQGIDVGLSYDDFIDYYTIFEITIF